MIIGNIICNCCASPKVIFEAYLYITVRKNWTNWNSTWYWWVHLVSPSHESAWKKISKIQEQSGFISYIFFLSFLSLFWIFELTFRSFLHFLSILPDLKPLPDYILIENVKGFETSHVFERLCEALDACKYNHQGFLLSPKHFGIPNSRMRLLFLSILFFLIFKQCVILFVLKKFMDFLIENINTYF